MRVTIVGSGDAFCSGGRAHTCIEVAVKGHSVLVDFGASSILAFKAQGRSFNAIDAIIISHLHGDHFGGLPYMLLDCQFASRRTRPLTIAGPPGLRDRFMKSFKLAYPGLIETGWNFEWPIVEVEPEVPTEIAGFDLLTQLVVHPSGAPATGIRLSHGGKTFAFSGDTEWTDKLYDIAAGADLFVTDCCSGQEKVPGHIDWPTLKENLPHFTAKRIAATHFSPSALLRMEDMIRAGVVPAHDGLSFDF